MAADTFKADPAGSDPFAGSQFVEKLLNLIGQARENQVAQTLVQQIIILSPGDGLRGPSDITDLACKIGFYQQIAASKGESDKSISDSAPDILSARRRGHSLSTRNGILEKRWSVQYSIASKVIVGDRFSDTMLLSWEV